MLILTHTDGLGVDLYQLCQRILQPAGNGYRGAQIHIKLREFLGCQLRCGIHRCTRLIDDHVADLREAAQHLHGHGLGFPGSGAVADGDMLHLMAADEGGKGIDGLQLLPLAEGGIYHRGGKHLTGGIHHRHHAAVAVAGVKTHGHKALYRRLHQKRLQVQGEVGNGAGGGPIRQLAADLPLQRGEDQPLVGILRRGADEGGYKSGGLQGGAADESSAVVSGQRHGRLQEAFLFAAVDGKDLVIQQTGDGLGKIVIKAVNAIRIRILCLAGQHGLPAAQLTQRLADIGIVGKILRDDVRCTGEGIFDGLHALLRVYITFRKYRRIAAILGKNGCCQRLQTLFPGDGGAGAALLLIGTVQILHLGKGGGIVDGGRQFLCQLALIFDGIFHLVPTGLEVAQIGKAGLQSTQGGIVHGTVHFLAVAGDKGDGVALVHQGNDVFHVFLLLSQLLRQNFSNGQHRFLLLFQNRILS